MKKKTKRLFLFAGYDKDGIIDDTLIHYLKVLSALGDIVLVMDCNVKDTSKLKNIKNILHIETKRHGEYDFGSYKRAYMWAHDKNLLNKYNWVYLVNDSVYGPLFDLEPCLIQMESKGVDLIGLTSYHDEYTPVHIQSWFLGLTKKLAASQILLNFMQSITHRKNKTELVYKYEVGLSRNILQHGYQMYAFLNLDTSFCSGNPVYKQPKLLLENFVPFIKKLALTNMVGSVYLLAHTSDTLNQLIFSHAERTGLKYPRTDIVDQYKKIYRLSLFSIPLCTIYRRTYFRETYYRVYLFDKIRILKIEKHDSLTQN